MRIDAPDGKLAGQIDIPNTRDKFCEYSTKLEGAKGVHDLYFVFKSRGYQKRNLFNFDWWEMKKI